MAAKSLEALNKSVRLDIDLAGFVCRLVDLASHWLTNCRLLKRLIRCSVKVAYADMKSLESDKITHFLFVLFLNSFKKFCFSFSFLENYKNE